jgi:anti-anti-sigma factor
VSSFHEPTSAAVADKIVGDSEVPLIGERPSGDRALSFGDVRSLDEMAGPSVYARKAVLSLEDLRSIDSHRIGWLLNLHNRFSEAGGQLVVHSIRPRPMETLRFLHLDRTLHVADDEAGARAVLRAGEAAGAE